MNPVRHIPMVPKPRRLPFIPRSSLQSIPAIRSLAWRRGASGTDDQYDPAVQGPDPYYDPNVESGTGTKSSYDSGTSASSSSGGSLPLPNTGVYSATQVAVTPASGANLRDQPSISGNVIAGENQGTILQVVGPQQDGWLHVQDPQGRVGWIYSAYVSDASQGQGTVSAPTTTPAIAGVAPRAAQVSSTPLGAGGIVGLLVVGGLVTGAYYLLVK